VHEACRENQAWINSATDHSTKWVPRRAVKPVPHAVGSLFREETGDAVVEVGVELVDDRLVLDDGEEAFYLRVAGGFEERGRRERGGVGVGRRCLSRTTR